MSGAWSSWGTHRVAAVAAWQPKSHIGVGIIDEIGSLCWSELNTSDSLGAEKFYTSVFGWGVKTSPTGAGTYTEWLSGGKSAAGMMQILPEWGPVPALARLLPRRQLRRDHGQSGRYGGEEPRPTDGYS